MSVFGVGSHCLVASRETKRKHKTPLFVCLLNKRNHTQSHPLVSSVANESEQENHRGCASFARRRNWTLTPCPVLSLGWLCSVAKAFHVRCENLHKDKAPRRDLSRFKLRHRSRDLRARWIPRKALGDPSIPCSFHFFKCGRP